MSIETDCISPEDAILDDANESTLIYKTYRIGYEKGKLK